MGVKKRPLGVKRPVKSTGGKMSRTKDYLQRLELAPGVYEAYFEQAESFRDHTSQFVEYLMPFRRLRFLKSKLFGRRYLVANYHSSSLHGSFDATAIMSLKAAGQESPPLVLTAKRGDSAKNYNWILEHEFVHIHQMLQGRMPKIVNEVGNPAAFLARRAELEFEAHYLQLENQGGFDPEKTLGMELEAWCCFRSYTCSLEDALACILSGQYSEDVSKDFLIQGPEQLGKELTRLKLEPFDAFLENYVGNFSGYLAVALQNVSERAGGQLIKERVEMVESWLLENSAAGSTAIARTDNAVTDDAPQRIQSKKTPERKAYYVEYEVTYRGRVGPFFVERKAGHFDLGENDEIVDQAIDRNAANAEYTGSSLCYHCSHCGNELSFENEDDLDNEDMFALFDCGCSMKT